jgi:hypothetical protein
MKRRQVRFSEEGARAARPRDSKIAKLAGKLPALRPFPMNNQLGLMTKANQKIGGIKQVKLALNKKLGCLSEAQILQGNFLKFFLQLLNWKDCFKDNNPAFVCLFHF